MKRWSSVLLVALAAFGSNERGLKPRSGPSDYPAHEKSGDLTIAAAVLSPDQVKAAFSTDLKGYIVVEVGLFPEGGRSIDVAAADFALRIGAQGEIVRAANPNAIAAANQRKSTPSPSRASDVTLYPTATIGVESNRGYDPVTGRRIPGGVYGGGGVGVGIGDQGVPPPRPGSTDRDREVMHQELSDKGLPEGATSAPIAGYIYFRLHPKARTSALELQYLAAGGKVRVPLPPVKLK